MIKRSKLKSSKFIKIFYWIFQNAFFRQNYCRLFPDTNKRLLHFYKCRDFNPRMHKMGPRRPKHYIFGDHFTQKMPESSGSMYSFILILENIWYYHFTWDRIHKKLWICSNLVRVPGDHNWNKIHNFLWIRSTSGKIMLSYVFYH